MQLYMAGLLGEHPPPHQKKPLWCVCWCIGAVIWLSLRWLQSLLSFGMHFFSMRFSIGNRICLKNLQVFSHLITVWEASDPDTDPSVLIGSERTFFPPPRDTQIGLTDQSRALLVGGTDHWVSKGARTVR